MIYVPYNDINDFACYVVQSGDVIRAYKSMPAVNSTSLYTDFYINSHYIEKEGSQTWNNYSTNLPVCISIEKLTNNYAYRHDFADILIITLILVGSVWFLFSKLIKTLLKGRKRY